MSHAVTIAQTSLMLGPDTFPPCRCSAAVRVTSVTGVTGVTTRRTAVTPVTLKIRSLPIELWPLADRDAWTAACQPAQRLKRGGPIARTLALAHDAFEPQLAGVLEDRGAVDVVEPFVQPQPGARRREQAREIGFALLDSGRRQCWPKSCARREVTSCDGFSCWPFWLPTCRPENHPAWRRL